MILLPFAPLLVKFVMKIMPGDDSEKISDYTIAIDDRILETPYIAIEQLKLEIINMGSLAETAFSSAMTGFLNNDIELNKNVIEIEKTINIMESEILEYLVKISNSSVSEEQRTKIDVLFNTVNDIARFCDHAENIAELSAYKIKHQLEFSSKAHDELEDMAAVAKKAIKIALNSIDIEDEDEANKVTGIEERIDLLERSLRKKHIRRLSDGSCKPKAAVVYLDVISNIERVGDHAMNIAEVYMTEEEEA